MGYVIFTDLDNINNKKRDQALESIEPVTILKNILIANLNELLFIDGNIHCTRQVDNAGRINVFNESFKVSEEFISGYDRATIYMKCQKLVIEMDAIMHIRSGKMIYIRCELYIHSNKIIDY